ncbi:MAG: RDD family protein [Verrucomicrobiota bacterium]
MNPSAPPDKLDTMQRVELASGVEVELHPAGPLVRAGAWMIDLLWIALINFGLLMVHLLASFTVGWEAGGGLNLLLAFFMSWFYRVLFEVRRGATPGQKSRGLKVVMTSGAPVTWSASLLRNLLRGVDFLPGLYLTGLASCLMTRRFQRLGDLVADTMVVYANPSDGPVSLIPSGHWEGARPPALALSREERGAIIRFAERLPMWSESRRQELADHLRELTGATGQDGVRRLMSIGRWLRDS